MAEQLDEYVEKFLKNLKQQTAPDPVQENLKIMRIINSWMKNDTKQYEDFRLSKGGPKSDAEYLGHMFAKAGIDFESAWEFAKKELAKYYDQESIDDGMDIEFKNEFYSVEPDWMWRKRVFK